MKSTGRRVMLGLVLALVTETNELNNSSTLTVAVN
jgi:hypothetical protein